MDDDFKEAVTATDTWLRLVFMLLFVVFYSITEIVVAVVVVVQFFFVLFTREKNERLLEFGEDLGVYIFQILQFQTFNTEQRPFPFGEWPYGSDDGIEPGQDDSTAPAADAGSDETKP